MVVATASSAYPIPWSSVVIVPCRAVTARIASARTPMRYAVLVQNVLDP